MLGKKIKSPFKETPASQEAPFPGATPAPADIHQDIKQGVGYPEESQAYPAVPKYQEPPAGQPMKAPLESSADYSPEPSSGAVMPPEEEEQFPFQEAQDMGAEPAAYEQQPAAYEQQPAYAPQPAAPNYEHMNGIAQGAADTVRTDLDAKINALKDEIDNLKRLDEEIHEVVDGMRKMEGKYAELAETAGALSPEELTDLKAKVDNISVLLSQGLPALITEIRSLKPKKTA